MRFWPAGAVILGLAAAAEAQTLLTPTQLTGVWGMGSRYECADGDTMVFAASGFWAVNNGGGNPFEAVGVWALAGDTITVTWGDVADLRYVHGIQVTRGRIVKAQPDHLVAEATLDGRPQVFDLYLCNPL